MFYSRIKAVGSYVPQNTVSNDDMSKVVDTNDEWISSRTGIKNRHFSTGENTSDLAAKAAEKILERAGVKAEEIELIIVATVSPDYGTPSTACLVQKKIGAVNAVAIQDGFMTGYNTDVVGFLQGMHNHGFSPAGKHAVLLGAGGAARAIIWGLIKEGVASLTIGVRNVVKAQAVADYFRPYMQIQVMDWQSWEFRRMLVQSQLLINSTPLGMEPNTLTLHPIDWAAVPAGIFVYDIIYTPAETMFLRMAREHGCQTLNGEEMLVGQGAEAFRIWTGHQLPTEPMAQALRKCLENQ